MTEAKCEAQHPKASIQGIYPRCWQPAGHTGPHTTIYGLEWKDNE